MSARPPPERWDPLNPSHERFDLDQWPFYRLARLASLYELRMDAVLKPVGMDVARWRVLMLLQLRGQATVTALATEAVVRLSTMAKILQRMEAQGLVARRPSAEDARAVLVAITARGGDVLTAVRERVRALSLQAFRDVTLEEIVRFNAAARKLHRNLEV